MSFGFAPSARSQNQQCPKIERVLTPIRCCVKAAVVRTSGTNIAGRRAGASEMEVPGGRVTMQFSRVPVELTGVGAVWLRLGMARTIVECIQNIGCVDTLGGVRK